MDGRGKMTRRTQRSKGGKWGVKEAAGKKMKVFQPWGCPSGSSSGSTKDRPEASWGLLVRPGAAECWGGTDAGWEGPEDGTLLQARSAEGHTEVTVIFRCPGALRPHLTPATRLPHHSYQGNFLF